MTFIGRVYSIKCDVSDFEYIGSTKQQLSARMSCHRRHAKWNKGKLYQYMREVGIEHFRIVPVAEVECETKAELRRAEDKAICERNTIKQGLNTYRAILTEGRRVKENKERCKKHYEENKEHYREYGLMYKAENADLIKVRNERYMENGGREVAKAYRESHKSNVKSNWCRYYGENAERLKAKAKVRYDASGATNCEVCNVSIKTLNFKKHLMSAKHKNAHKPKPTKEEMYAAKLGRNRVKSKGYVHCECCGVKVSKANIGRHKKTTLHIRNFIWS
jgi:hypothetical protein